MATAEDIIRTHLQELRRGTVVVASLIALREPGYGYGLLQQMAEHRFPVDANTLYPLLRRLEDQGLLTSEWNTEESRPRKVYRTSAKGEQVLHLLLEDMRAVQDSFTSLMGEEA
ncbi:PadR family transcriptional regulator [Nocardioides seonyuensis]|uniref:PadR family transcriptional regulator n=1 Tax=Nocardioides seonyuensis TaxID=2518371 RepID=A0A4P7IFD8_9ACTN|nr:PadR family transcriptional regulator [Nocardioides seonyuensis]QBX54401.1 PadR family transcriptional regulator [Nocardioides seonyuensis]